MTTDGKVALVTGAARRAASGGRLVFVSSPAAARAITGTLEAVAGACLTTVAQVAAVELAPRAVTANVVIPALDPD